MTAANGLPWHVIPVAGPDDEKRIAEFSRHMDQIADAFGGSDMRIGNEMPLWNDAVAPSDYWLRSAEIPTGTLAPMTEITFARRFSSDPESPLKPCMKIVAPVPDPSRSHLHGFADAFRTSHLIAQAQADKNAVAAAKEAAARTMGVMRHIFMAAKAALGSDAMPGDSLRVAHGLAGAPAYLHHVRTHRLNSAKSTPMADPEDVRRAFVNAGCEPIISTSMSTETGSGPNSGYPMLKASFVHSGIRLDQWSPSPLDLVRSLRRVHAPDIDIRWNG